MGWTGGAFFSWVKGVGVEQNISSINHYNMAVKCFWWSMEEKGKGNERAQPEDAPSGFFVR